LLDHTQINRGRQTGNTDKFDFVKLILKDWDLPLKEVGSPITIVIYQYLLPVSPTEKANPKVGLLLFYKLHVIPL